MLSDEIISNNIATCKQKGNAITYIPCAEAMLESDNKDKVHTLKDKIDNL